MPDGRRESGTVGIGTSWLRFFERYGDTALTRMRLNLNVYHRPLDLIAQDWGMSETTLRVLLRNAFDKYIIAGESYYTLKPEAAAYQKEWQEYAEQCRRDVEKAEKWIAEAVKHPEHADDDLVLPTPGTTRAFRELRGKMGRETFGKFMRTLGSDETHVDVAAEFQGFGVEPRQVALWRTVLTREARVLLPELLKHATGLRLVKMEKMAMQTVIRHITQAA